MNAPADDGPKEPGKKRRRSTFWLASGGVLLLLCAVVFLLYRRELKPPPGQERYRERSAEGLARVRELAPRGVEAGVAPTYGKRADESSAEAPSAATRSTRSSSPTMTSPGTPQSIWDDLHEIERAYEKPPTPLHPLDHSDWVLPFYASFAQNLHPSEMGSSIEDEVRRRLTNNLDFAHFQGAYSASENKQEADRLEQFKAEIPRWKSVADAAEKFLLREPYSFPAFDVHPPPWGWEFPIQSNLLRVAIARAVARGESEKTKKLFLRAVEAVRNRYVFTFPGRGVGVASSMVTFAGTGEGLDSATLRQAFEMIKAARISPANFDAIWPAHVARVHKQLDTALDQIAAAGWTNRMRTNPWHFFFSGRPEQTVSRLFLPVAHAKLEGLMAAYAELDTPKIKNALRDFDLALGAINVDAGFSPESGLNFQVTPEQIADHVAEKKGSAQALAEEIDQTLVALALIRYKTDNGRNPVAIGDLGPPYLEPGFLEGEGSRWHLVVIKPFSLFDHNLARVDKTRSAEHREERVKSLGEISTRFYRDHGRRIAETPEELKPYLTSEAEFEEVKRYFFNVTETLVFVHETVGGYGQVEFKLSWPSFSDSEMRFVDLLK